MTPQQVRGDDADDPTTYLVSFDDTEARYLVYALTKTYIFVLSCIIYMSGSVSGSLYIFYLCAASSNEACFKKKESERRKIWR